MQSGAQTTVSLDDFEVIEEINKGMFSTPHFPNSQNLGGKSADFRYKLLNLGCFGKVSKIRRKETGEILVWKEIDYSDISEKERKLIITEVNIMRTIEDSHIVQYDSRVVDQDKKKIYIVMEYCEKGDLKQLLEKHKKSGEPIKEEYIWEVMTQMLLALDTCHNNPMKKIIHRDLKPGNIFIDGRRNIKLGDFGLSKELSESVHCTKTNVGTPYYMAPEICSGQLYNEK